MNKDLVVYTILLVQPPRNRVDETGAKSGLFQANGLSGGKKLQ